jgi:threonine/homoserine/homoserine lactone efflux protein
MPFDTALALMTFAFVAAMTPGPNNIMVTASGVNFGFTRTVPHMAGILVGFVVLVLAVGAGVGAILATAPAWQLGLKVLGAAYMLWLAWKVANAGSPSDSADERSRPMTFWQAAAFQWVNPKAWVMTVSAMALYVRPDYVASDVAIVTAVFGVMTIPAVGTWAAFGHALRNLLRDPSKLRVFNVVMALLLVASIAPMVAG